MRVSCRAAALRAWLVREPSRDPRRIAIGRSPLCSTLSLGSLLLTSVQSRRTVHPRNYFRIHVYILRCDIEYHTHNMYTTTAVENKADKIYHRAGTQQSTRCFAQCIGVTAHSRRTSSSVVGAWGVRAWACASQARGDLSLNPSLRVPVGSLWIRAVLARGCRRFRRIHVGLRIGQSAEASTEVLW